MQRIREVDCEVLNAVEENTLSDERRTYLDIQTKNGENRYFLEGETEIKEGDNVDFSYSSHKERFFFMYGYPIHSIELTSGSRES